eukprot:4261310-Pleurochrysis_carterae.AAC.1
MPLRREVVCKGYRVEPGGQKLQCGDVEPARVRGRRPRTVLLPKWPTGARERGVVAACPRLGVRARWGHPRCCGEGDKGRT